MTGAPVGRRQVVAGLGALAVAPVAARIEGPPLLAQGTTDPFGWGVASFDPARSSVLLWTRARPGDGAPVALRWQVFADEGLAEAAVDGTATATVDEDHCVTVEATGLPAGRTWWYRFELADGSARSPVGRTRTLPEGRVERLRVAAVSCSRYAAGGFAAYRALADRELDLVLHLGDYVYEDGASGIRAHDPPEELRTLEQYRRRYAQHRADPDLQALHARDPMVAVWDDHELAGNAWRDGAAAHDEAVDGPWADRRRAATRAHGEWLPGRTRTGPEDRLEPWRALEVGDLAEVLVLDTRSWRDRPAATAPELTDGGPRSLLGPAQRAWLDDRLRRTDRPPWVLVANQVMFHPLRVPIPSQDLAAQVEASGFLVVAGQAVNPDQWDGYAAEREAVVAAIGDRGGVVVLTGDVHSSWAWEGPAADGDGRPSMVELVTPSVSSTSLGDRLPVSPTLLEAALGAVDPDLAFVELTRHGYLVADLGPDELRPSGGGSTPRTRRRRPSGRAGPPHGPRWRCGPSTSRSPTPSPPPRRPRPPPPPPRPPTPAGAAAATGSRSPPSAGRPRWPPPPGRWWPCAAAADGSRPPAGRASMQRWPTPPPPRTPSSGCGSRPSRTTCRCSGRPCGWWPGASDAATTPAAASRRASDEPSSPSSRMRRPSAARWR